MATSAELDVRRIIESRQATVAIRGLGYVGLPLVVAFGDAGFRTVCIVVHQSRIQAVNREEFNSQGTSP